MRVVQGLRMIRESGLSAYSSDAQRRYRSLESVTQTSNGVASFLGTGLLRRVV